METHIYNNFIFYKIQIIRFDSAANIVAKNLNKDKDCCIIALIDKAEQASSIGTAISRIFPPFTKKTGKEVKRTVIVNFIVSDNTMVNYAELQIVSNAIRYASKLGDTPAEEMSPTQGSNYVIYYIFK